jgi:hypothetical protein
MDKIAEKHFSIDPTVGLPDEASERADVRDVSEFPDSLRTSKHGALQPTSNLKPSAPAPRIVWRKLMLEP